MTEQSTHEAVIHPLSASADGKRNTYSRRCEVIGQTMNYAACQWRNGVLSRNDIRTPVDWEPCRNAMRCGTCNAVNMREEEVLKGHSIYFRERASFGGLLKEAARTWLGMDYWGKKKDPSERSTAVLLTPAAPRPATKPAAPAPKPAARRSGDALDAMGDLGGYEDAISAAYTAAPAPAPVSAPVAAPLVSSAESLIKRLPMLPGESPLEYSRRLRAAREQAPALS